MPLKRYDPRHELTRAALIDAAEELFAGRCIENVSLRQIGEAIGSDNNAAARYYCGSKVGLLQAIGKFSERLFWQRLRLISTMVILAIQDAVELEQAVVTRARSHGVFADTLQLATSAFLSPEGPASSLRRFKRA